MVALNCETLVYLQASLSPAMADRGRGAIINIASTSAFQPIPFTATYAATKSFVLSLSEGTHNELGGKGVTVTAVCPGPVKTEFADQAGLEAATTSFPGFIWTDVEQVAREAVEGAEKGSRVVVPGIINRAGTVLGQHTPRSVVLPLAKRRGAPPSSPPTPLRPRRRARRRSPSRSPTRSPDDAWPRTTIRPPRPAQRGQGLQRHRDQEHEGRRQNARDHVGDERHRAARVGHPQAAGPELGEEVVVERDPVQDRLPEPALVRPGRREGRILGRQTVLFEQKAKRPRRQEQPTRPLGEGGPAVAAERSLPARPVGRGEGPSPVRPFDLDPLELRGEVDRARPALDPGAAPIAPVDEARAAAARLVGVDGRRKPDARLRRRGVALRSTGRRRRRRAGMTSKPLPLPRHTAQPLTSRAAPARASRGSARASRRAAHARARACTGGSRPGSCGAWRRRSALPSGHPRA